MIPVKEAANRAAAFAKELGTAGDETAWLGPFRLEEVEQDEVKGTKVWLITLSIPKPDVLFTNIDERLYRVFAVDKETGEVLSMKIREFAGAHG